MGEYGRESRSDRTYLFGFTRDCYLVTITSERVLAGKDSAEYQEAIGVVHQFASEADARLQNPSTYGLPPCASSTDTTDGDPCSDALEVFSDSLLTKEEACDIVSRAWPEPRPTGWGEAWSAATERANDVRRRLLLVAPERVQGAPPVQTDLSDEQRNVMEALAFAWLLGSFAPDGASPFPVRKALTTLRRAPDGTPVEPVLGRMAAAAILPPPGAPEHRHRHVGRHRRSTHHDRSTPGMSATTGPWAPTHRTPPTGAPTWTKPSGGGPRRLATSSDGFTVASTAEDLLAAVALGPRVVATVNGPEADPAEAFAGAFDTAHTVVGGPQETTVDGHRAVAVTLRWT